MSNIMGGFNESYRFAKILGSKRKQNLDKFAVGQHILSETLRHIG